MIPSVLARQLQQGVEDFLLTTFPISTPHFHGLVERLLATEGGLFKGPYVSASLPFRQAESSGEFFPEVPLGWRPFLHQEQAFRRLGGDAPRSTLVATGTGSGKTESFLVPILDYCRRHQNRRGIKAILVYPMNALANDQAGRIASMVARTPSLQGRVRAGLYVGQRDEETRRVMSPEGIITDRDTLRLDPPDILLTNYKMLDYLLVRPEDYALWEQNDPETLRFMVVDELHTFDGAQGTDLACLIRRLRARLGTPKGYLCCVGTSATLGGSQASEALVEYAGKIFGEPFDQDAVIGESRQSEAEFLEESYVQAHAAVDPNQAHLLDSGRYGDFQDYLRAQVELWTRGTLQIQAWDDPTWRVELGEFLKSHPLFRNTLHFLKGRVRALADLNEALTGVIPELRGTDATYRRDLFDSLLALVAAARVPVEERPERQAEREARGEPQPLRPLVELRVQLWLRELRRMVASVGAEPQLSYFDDLSEEARRSHLPVIHCRECGSTGWGARKRALDPQLDPDLRSFYQAFFAYHPNTAFLFPGEPQGDGTLSGVWLWLDPATLRLEPARSGDNAIRVFLPDSERKTQDGKVQTHHDCPFCEGRDSLTILGSRAASLTSVLITQLYASSFNRDKKLIAFSDSVQDASHRAGFFGARTYRFNLRSAVQQFIDAFRQTEMSPGPLTLATLPRAMAAHYREQSSVSEFVASFLAPDMEWLSDYDAMLERGQIDPDSNLLELVERRIEWEVLAEFGHRSRIGRTLEKSGGAVPAPDPERLEGVVERLRQVISNEIGGFRDLDVDSVRVLLLGFLDHLRTRGGVYQEWLESFISTGGNPYLLNRQLHTPYLPARARILSFLTRTRHPAFDALLSGGSAGSRSWYEEWVEKCLSPVNPMVSAQLPDVLEFVVAALEEAGFLVERKARGESVWGVNPEALLVEGDVASFACRQCGHSAFGAGRDAAHWDDAPCPRFRCGGRLAPAPSGALDYYGALYRRGDLKRIVAREHTGLQPRGERETLERSFIQQPHPWSPNLLSCTPTLEMGIDIGDLSTVLLCSVPPAQANYIQRIGRAGRRDGNALSVAVANGRPHDLYFYAEPEEMIEGDVEPPGVFLRAAAVLERQMTAYALDRWVETRLPPGAIPSRLRPVLEGLNWEDSTGFPWNFLAFVEGREVELVEGFLGLFGDELNEDARDYVRKFVLGSDDGQGDRLDHKLLNGLRQLERERRGLVKDLERARRKVQAMEREEVRDQNHEKELQELRRERDALSRMIRESIDQRHTLNFLTDEGLVPNYAFPEAGIVLRSVIYRKRRPNEEGDGEWDTRVFEYQRPAVRAITELAPSNRFYAEGRNVEIDRIDMSSADLEYWRLCDNCSYGENEAATGGRAPAANCPRCESPQWSDAGQRHPMLRMRQVWARTADRRSRTGDDTEERRPAFFKKQLLVDYSDQDITQAYSLDDDELPFGFEFLSRASFREINFGEVAFEGADVRIAGDEAPRKGFTICRHCGTVARQGGETRHALSCPARSGEKENTFVQALYLYREFSSEAIRILLPETTLTGSERTRHSFIAALQLGLKRVFGGAIDHLRVTQYEEPIRESEHRKRSLVLYDTVPGGTGYLKELMRSREPLLKVFRQALLALNGCSCHADEAKDGCYRCLFAYRNAYDMPDTSRDRAIELLSDILAREARFKEVDSLRNLPVNALFDSELEARFVSAFREASSEARPIRVSKQVVGRRAGYRLEVGESAWTLVPQVSLGPSDDVAIPARADFLLSPAARPTKVRGDVRPIAVFLDGWAYHRGRIGKDLAQRAAIGASGKYHVWSLSWKDVERAHDGSLTHVSELLGPRGVAPSRGRFEAMVDGFNGTHGVGTLGRLWAEGSFQWLLRYLAEPDPTLWQAYAMVEAILHVDAAASRPGPAQEAWRTQVADGLPSSVADLLLDLEPGVVGFTNPGGRPVRFYLGTRPEAVQALDGDGLAFVCVLDDGETMRNHPDFQSVWNGVLRLHTVMQFLPGALVLSTSALAQGLDGELDLARLRRLRDDPPPPAEAPEWEEAREFALPEAHPLLDALGERGVPAPGVGHELLGERGRVAGEAELAWPDRQVAVLMAEQMGAREAFVAAGWTVLSLEEALADPGALAASVSPG